MRQNANARCGGRGSSEGAEGSGRACLCIEDRNRRAAAGGVVTPRRRAKLTEAMRLRIEHGVAPHGMAVALNHDALRVPSDVPLDLRVHPPRRLVAAQLELANASLVVACAVDALRMSGCWRTSGYVPRGSPVFGSKFARWMALIVRLQLLASCACALRQRNRRWRR